MATYAADTRRFVAWAGGRAAVDIDGPAACLLLSEYQASLADRGLSAATVNRCLASLCAPLRAARAAGLIDWTYQPTRRPDQPYRDTRGPGSAAVATLLRCLQWTVDMQLPRPPMNREAWDRLQWTHALARRDLLGVRLSWDLALRRQELVRLRLEDLEPAGEPDRLRVRGKGGRVEWLTLPATTREALASWLEVRRYEPGPLLCACTGGGTVAYPLRSLHPGQWWRRLRQLAQLAQLEPVRPHGLRHSSITAALDTGAPVRSVQRFSRHARMDTLNRYDDNRADLGGAVAEVVSRVPGLLG